MCVCIQIVKMSKFLFSIDWPVGSSGLCCGRIRQDDQRSEGCQEAGWRHSGLEIAALLFLCSLSGSCFCFFSRHYHWKFPTPGTSSSPALLLLLPLLHSCSCSFPPTPVVTALLSTLSSDEYLLLYSGFSAYIHLWNFLWLKLNEENWNILQTEY